jgi:type II secretory pathway component PulJ
MTKKIKGMSLLEILIYTVLFSLVSMMLLSIIIYYQKSSKTIDTQAHLMNNIITALTIIDYDFNNAGYMGTPDGVTLQAIYTLDENSNVIRIGSFGQSGQPGSQEGKIIVEDNGDKDKITVYYQELEENRLGYIRNATLLGGGNASEINIDPNVLNLRDSSVQQIWPDPNDSNDRAYPIIVYSKNSNGQYWGVIFYVTTVQHNSNRMQHRPVSFYGGDGNGIRTVNNRNIASIYLPDTSNVRVLKPKNILRVTYRVENGNLIRSLYNFRTDTPFSNNIILTNVESFNVRVVMDNNNDGLPDTNANGTLAYSNTNNSDRVAMIEYTIVLKTDQKNLVGLNRNPLTGQGGDGYKRIAITRTVMTRNFIEPEL